MPRWHPIALACLVACGSARETTSIDLLSVLDEGAVEAATTTVDVGEPAAARLLGDGWGAPARLPDGTTGREMTSRTATITLFAGPTPVDAELRLERRALDDDPGDRRRRPSIALVDLNGVRLRPIRDRARDVLRFRLPSPLQRAGRNLLTVRQFTPGGPMRQQRMLVTRVDVRHAAPPPPSARIDGDRLRIPAGDGITFFFRAPAEPRLSLAIEPDDGSASITLLRDGAPPVTVAPDGRLDAPAGTVVGLRIAGPRDLTVVRPAVVGLTTPAAAPAAPSASRPNVIVYVADTLRADGLGCYGGRGGTSPSLDRLAADGIVFERTLSSSSWTRPATATILTGLDPIVHGAMTIRDRIRDDARTLAERLRDAGWSTAAFVTNANVAAPFGFGRGFDVYRYLPEDLGRPGVHVPAATMHAEALAWLDARPPDRPFLLYLHATDVHMPYDPPDALGARFVGADAWAALDRRRLLRAVDERPETLDVDDTATVRALYDAEIADLDAAIGGLWDALVARGLDRTTVVVFAADHGEEFAEHGGFEHGTTLFDEQMRVPLIVRLPAARGGGRRVAGPARLLDVTPTVLALAGLPPDGALPGTALLDADGTPAAPSAEARAWTGVGRAGVSALETTPWKVVLGGATRVEVFDVAADPAERDDRSAAHPVLIGYARQQLAAAARRAAPPATAPAVLDPDLAARLRGLGYLDD